MGLLGLRNFIFLLTVLLLPIQSGFAEEEVKEVEELSYQLYPDIITNLSFKPIKAVMRVRITAYTFDKDTVKMLKTNEALLRDKIILVFNQKTRPQMTSSSELVKIKKEIVTLINTTLHEEEEQDAKVTRVEFKRFIVE